MLINVCDFLENTCAKVPEKIAFIEGDRSISYKEFDTITNAIASEILSFLKPKHYHIQSPILVILPKGIDCLSAFFGVAKSGNFYTLMDEKTPKERILKVCEVLKPALLITSKALEITLEIPTLYTEDFKNFQSNLSLINTAKEAHIDTNLLYVFFTSGSTGIPKGVSISHKSVIDYIFWVTQTFNVSQDEILANQSPFYFDNSILDIFSSIKMGATLHILPNPLFAFPNKILKYLELHKVTMIFWVPSVLIYFANTNALENFKLPNLTKIFFAGEIMPNKQLNIWRKALPNAIFANLYGLTEITDICSYFIVDREFRDDAILPIGKACRNTQLLVFDENLQLILPKTPYVKGELYVRGTSLSLGYYADSKRTKATFIQNPLHNNFYDPIYKSGDIVAYNEFSELLCYGRVDNQIKLQGHRIELGEIETALIGIQGIKNAACVFKNDAIYAFYEAQRTFNFKEILKNKLPSYMIPKYFIQVAEFKLNQNGKIDRKILNEQI